MLPVRCADAERSPFVFSGMLGAFGRKGVSARIGVGCRSILQSERAGVGRFSVW